MKRPAETAIALALGLLAIAVWAPLVPVGFGLADEGWLLTAIDRLVAGERLYVDVYRSYGPGLYWTFAAFSRAVDGDALTVRWVWLVGLVVLSVGSFRLARPWLPLWAAAGVGLLPILLRPPAHKTFVPLAYLGALFLCRAVVRRHGRALARGTLVGLGVGFGALALFRQEAAAFGMAITWCTVCANPARAGRSAIGHALFAAAGLAAGAAVVWLPVLAVLAANGALGDAIEQLVLVGARGNAAMGLPFPNAAGIFSGPERLRTSFFFLPAVAAVSGGVLSWQWLRSPTRHKEGLLLAQWSAITVLAHTVFLSRADFPHLSQALVAPTLVAGWCVAEGFRASPARRIAAAGAAAWIVVGAAWLTDVPGMYARRASAVPMTVPGNELLVSPQEARVLGELVATIQREVPPDRPILVLPFSPGIYHLAERRNASRHDAVLPGYASDAIQREVIDALDRERVPLVVADVRPTDGRPERTLARFAPTLTAHLTGRYEPIERIGVFQLLRRRSH